MLANIFSEDSNSIIIYVCIDSDEVITSRFFNLTGTIIDDLCERSSMLIYLSSRQIILSPNISIASSSLKNQYDIGNIKTKQIAYDVQIL